MRCPECAFDNPAEARFCGSCGRPLGETCRSCGAENPPAFRFCASCGASLEAAAEPSAEPPTLAGERRRVTVLFADLVGFSTLAEHLDPEELRTLMADTFAELTEEVERREGVVEKFIGDAVVAVFGAPVSHEDDPARAVEAARGMLDVIDRRSVSAPSRLELRIGINSGLVVAGAVGDGSQTGVMGDTVNVAARLQQSASPGEVLVAAATWRRVRDAYDAEAIGALEVKGKTQAVEAFRLGGRREGDVRLLSPFVGRRDELALIELLWSSTCKGNTHVVSIIGEPGVGKSRLLTELAPHRDALDLRIACGGERAFGPFLVLVEQVLGGYRATSRSWRLKRPRSSSIARTRCCSARSSVSRALHQSYGWPTNRECARSSPASGVSCSPPAKSARSSSPSTTPTGSTSRHVHCSRSSWNSSAASRSCSFSFTGPPHVRFRTSSCGPAIPRSGSSR